MVLFTTDMFKDVRRPKNHGALGTGFTYALVLLFELYLAINNSSTIHSKNPISPKREMSANYCFTKRNS